jgi:hypothetical protein
MRGTGAGATTLRESSFYCLVLCFSKTNTAFDPFNSNRLSISLVPSAEREAPTRTNAY